jgi:NAD(P)-dependent dehydrogenase (short-subunit alcohol dehydrogenase family)
VHRLDAAHLFRLALENAPAGSRLHAVVDEGVPIRAIAEVMGRHLDLPVVSVPAGEARGHFGFLASFLAAGHPVSSALTASCWAGSRPIPGSSTTSIRATTSTPGPHCQPSRIVTTYRAKSYVTVGNGSGGIMKAKWTSDDVPGQQGRLAVVTGANTGLGFETARVLAARGASVVLAVRDIEKGKRAAARIAGTAPGANVTVQPLDLASLDSIRAAAGELRARHPRIDLLINNAGVMLTPRQTTRDGFELQLGTNHLGHFALTGLLLEQMLPVPGSRVVTVSSLAHRIQARINFDDLQGERSYSRVAAYSQSKLANLMFTYELQRRLPGAGTTVAVAAHPGLASTELARYTPAIVASFYTRVMTQKAAMGALPTLRAATDPGVLGGQYYGPGGLFGARGYPKLAKSSRRSRDTAIQRRLWAVSEELTGVTFPL